MKKVLLSAKLKPRFIHLAWMMGVVSALYPFQNRADLTQGDYSYITNTTGQAIITGFNIAKK